MYNKTFHSLRSNRDACVLTSPSSRRGSRNPPPSCYIFLIYGRRFCENTLVPAESTDSDSLSPLYDIHTANAPRNVGGNTVMERLRAS